MAENTKFPFIENPTRNELWKKKLEFVNPLKEAGAPSLQDAPGHELSPEETIDVDDRALRDPNCPNIVFGRPHAGEFVPKGLWDRMEEAGKRSFQVIDRGTGFVFRSSIVPSVGSKVNRMIADPNRPSLPDQEGVSKKAPGKVVWTKDFFGKEIYKEGQTPSEKEIVRMSATYYIPYYRNVMGLVGSVADRRKEESERVLFLDGHSFPVSKNFKEMMALYEIKDMKELSLFIIGDKYVINDQEYTSCDSDITQALAEALERNFRALPEDQQKALLKNSASGSIVGINEKGLKGAQNNKFFGQRGEGVNALQLELNDGAFVDEVDDDYFRSSYDFEKLEIVRRLVEKSCLDINPILKGKK